MTSPLPSEIIPEKADDRMTTPAHEDRDGYGAVAIEFLVRAAYAIRSPVNIILGYSELIAQRLAALGDDSQRPYLEGIGRSGKQILAAIERILDYTRLEE